MEERHLSLSEAANALDISERTAYRWIKSGKLSAYKPGRDYWIPESAVKEVVEESKVRPKGPRPHSLRKFLLEGVGHSYFTDQALEELERVDDATMTLYDVEYVAFLNATSTGEYTREEKERIFDVPYKDVVRKYSTVLTAYRTGMTVADAVDLMRRDLLKEGFQSRTAQRDETA